MASEIAYGLVGRSLGHSFSKKFFDNFFIKHHIENVSYENFELETIGELEEILQKDNLRGFNVTFPYKEEIRPFLSDIDPLAASIGAVNCVKRVQSEWLGYNTDIIGFKKSILPLLFPRHKKALIFGSGGASKTVQYALKELGIAYDIVSSSGAPGTISYNAVHEEQIHASLLLVNCTPLGTYPEIESSVNIPYHAISRRHLLYDLVYNPVKSDFLRSGESMGAVIKNGLEMLEIQAMESWKIWQE
jgi:shikimate dehydrogenase